jgi:UDP-N-acetyl-D-mannosaminuronate dehydrogenase
MKPGLGVGGYCLTKDPLFAKIAVNEFFPHIKNLSFPFIDLTIETNKNMPIRNYNRIKKLIGNNLKNKKILILGVAYRQDVDDTRHSAVFTLYKKLLSSGANLTCHDPMVKFWKEANLEIDNKLPNSSNFDMIIFTVPHSYYIKMNIESWLGNNRSVIYDCDNVLSEDLINKLKIKGLKLQSTGRGN